MTSRAADFGVSMEFSIRTDYRLSTSGTRRLLLVASILVFLVGVQLFVLTEATETLFAWTIQTPLTAASLGAAYWASFTMEFIAARQRWWASARVAVPAVLVFTAITFIVSIVHIDRFHVNAPDSVTRFLTWGWLCVYAVVPPAMLLILWRQIRTPGIDPPREQPLPNWYRALLLVHAALLVPVGLILLVAPAVGAQVWPWALTPLTARAIGAWSLGIGIAAVHAVWENDWKRVRPATASYIALGSLELVALARFPGDVAWDSPQAWVYVWFLLSALVAGAYGFWMASGNAARHADAVSP